MSEKKVPKFYECVTPKAYEGEGSKTSAKENVPDFLKDNVFVVLDLETTGCRAQASGPADRIIEVGACKIVEGDIVETFSSLINPEMPIPWNITDLTGINNRMVLMSPTYEEVMPDFYKFCYGSYLVGHNIKRFDIRFLRRYWSELGFFGEFDMIDTIDLAHKVLPGLENYQLPTVGRRLGYSFGGGNSHHRALNDTVITAKIFGSAQRLGKWPNPQLYSKP